MVSVVMVLLATALFGVAGLVWDGGLAISARQRAADLAGQAARAGADVMDVDAARSSGADRIDPMAANAAACGYLAVAAPQASCRSEATTSTVTVHVTTTASTAVLGIVGIHQLTTRGEASARTARGVITEERP